MDAGRPATETLLPSTGSGSSSGDSSEAEAIGSNLLRLLHRVTSSASGLVGAPTAGATLRTPSLRQLLVEDTSAAENDADVPCPPSQPDDSNGEAVLETEQQRDETDDEQSLR